MVVFWVGFLVSGLRRLQVATHNDSVRPIATRSDPFRPVSTLFDSKFLSSMLKTTLITFDRESNLRSGSKVQVPKISTGSSNAFTFIKNATPLNLDAQEEKGWTLQSSTRLAPL